MEDGDIAWLVAGILLFLILLAIIIWCCCTYPPVTDNDQMTKFIDQMGHHDDMLDKEEWGELQFEGATKRGEGML